MRIIGLKQKGGFATHCLIENEKFLVNIDGLDAAEVDRMRVLELQSITL